jgi:uncharacterized protein (TIGR00369 family)
VEESWFDFLRKDYLQGFPARCGFEVTHVGPGRFETRLVVEEGHRQQDGFVHAGVMATMADHTAGYAAYTTVDRNHRILTIEFKINFFKPARGPELQCRSRVLEGGRSIKASESEVFDIGQGKEKRVAKALVTLMAVPAERLRD